MNSDNISETSYLPLIKEWNSKEGKVHVFPPHDIIPEDTKNCSEREVIETGAVCMKCDFEGMLVYPLTCCFLGCTHDIALELDVQLQQRFKRPEHFNQKTEFHQLFRTEDKGSHAWILEVDIGMDSEEDIHHEFQYENEESKVRLLAFVDMRSTKQTCTIRFDLKCLHCDDDETSCDHLAKFLGKCVAKASIEQK